MFNKWIWRVYAAILWILFLPAMVFADSPNVSFDNIPASIRKPGYYFEFNSKLAARTLPQNPQKVMLLGQRLGTYIEPARWQGGTLNDLISSGTYTGNSATSYIVKITTAGSPDKFKWTKDNGVTWSSETDITSATSQAIEAGVTASFINTNGHSTGDKWYFTAWPEAGVAKELPTQGFSDAEFGAYFGYGSTIHMMARAAIKTNAYLQLYATALDDNGSTKATGSIIFSNTASIAGTHSIYIGNQKFDIVVAKNTTAAAQAIALQNEIAKSLDILPVTIAVDRTQPRQINVVYKNAGTVGNQLNLGYYSTVGGTTVSITNMTSGAGDPDVDDALTACYAGDYNIYVTPYNTQTEISKIEDHLDSISGPIEQRPAIAVYATNGALADATTLAGQVNHERVNHPYVRYTSATRRQSPAYEIAAAYAARVAYEEDPARPLNTLALTGIAVPDISDRISRTEQESLLYNGVTPLEVSYKEEVVIVRAITTYTTNAQGIADIAFLDLTTIRTLDYVRKACRDRIALRFPRSKKTSAVKNSIRSELISVLKALEGLGIVENVDDNLDDLVVEDDSVDPNRVNARIPTDVVNGLHIFAGRIDLIL